MGCSQIFTVGIEVLQLDLVLIRLGDMSFNGMFSDLYCRYTGPEGGSGFNQIGGHDFQ